jgi:hypothetical protein
MERREFIALIGMASALMPAGASAEPVYPSDSAAGLLPGSWRFASSVNTRRDGSTFDRWGENPRGLFMFDRNGNYTQIILGSESRVFGAKVFCAFGTYKIDESEKVLITRIDGCSASKLNGTVQNRAILSLTKEELRYTNPLTASGSIAEARWKRLG